MTTYSSSIRNGTGTIKLEIRQDSQSIANNTSTVYYRLYIQGVGGYGFWNEYNSGQTSVYINGSRVHYQTGRNFNIRGGGTQQLASGTTTVKHNEDGSKSFSFSASLWSSSATGSISGNFNLSKIPRASSFSLQNESGSNISSVYAGETIIVAISKKVSSFTHTVKISYAGNSDMIVDKSSGSSIRWTNSMNILTRYMQNLQSMNITFTVETYDGRNRVGTSSKTLTLKVPSSAAPTISSVNIREANKNKINIIGETPFYQLLSDLNILTKTSAKYGASIKNISVGLGNYTKSGSSVILDNVNLKGNQNIKVTVKDSRGLSTSTTKTIHLSPYDMPNIAFFNAYRTEINTKYASARLSLTSTVIEAKNPLSVKVDVAEKGSSSWRNVYYATVGNGKLNDTISLGGGFDDFKAYDVRLTISDKFKRHQAISNIPATSQSLVIGANKPVVGIGKVPDIDKGLDIKDFAQIEGANQKKFSFKGTKDSGSLIEWRTDGTQTNWICSWGGTLDFGGSDVSFREGIKVSKDLYLGGDIKPYRNAGQEIDLVLASGLTGYIKAKKDAFGGVRVYGNVIVNDINLTRRYRSWAKLPPGYLSQEPTQFGLQCYKLNVESDLIAGMLINSDGNIVYGSLRNLKDDITVGYTCRFNVYYKTEGSW